MKKRVSEALSLVGMAEFTKKNQLACQVVRNREWLSQELLLSDQIFLILDEATSMLDPEGTTRVD